MCGFVALFNPQREPAPHAVDLLKRMTDSLQHRGPDAQGYHIEPHIALGHRRLSIIDVSTGQQPLFNEDGSPTARSKQILGHTPMGRFGEAHELAGATVFLAASKASGFVTGTDIRVDGGYLSQTI